MAFAVVRFDYFYATVKDQPGEAYRLLSSLADVHMKLRDAGVSVYASNGVADGKGNFGHIVHVRSEAYDGAVAALGI